MVENAKAMVWFFFNTKVIDQGWSFIRCVYYSIRGWNERTNERTNIYI
jgi:hypothetical protein